MQGCRAGRRSKRRRRVVATLAYWNTTLLRLRFGLALTLGLIRWCLLVLIAMARIEEIATIAFGRKPARLIAEALPAPAGDAPKVSIHVPAYFEPPEMEADARQVARLDYPNFECVVIINNTPDPTFWQPIQDHCRTLGERFIFINAEKVQGFKAGALRIAWSAPRSMLRSSASSTPTM
jgi:cellulose synthase/poly-beta-1,6-N-acetylglucosamine synthase-like glycosyltransferase